MEWFGIHINNPISLTKIGLASFAFVLGSFGAMSFTLHNRDFELTDSVNIEKSAFKSLFANNRFDATKPYAAQLNPKGISFVQDYIKKQGKELEHMKLWGKPYFDLYDNILEIYQIPKEMKYLSVIESHLTPGLVSWAGAVGPWQLMPDEAKRFGLQMGKKDDRTDFYKSTHVAARLMKELYGEFGDWLLVVAAYNGGAGRVKQAIRKAGSKDFWDIQYYLPEETRNHVKKFIGTHYIFEGSGGWTTMTAAETANQKLASATFDSVMLTDLEIKNTATIEISGRYMATVVAAGVKMDIQDFNKWNPNFDKMLASGKPYNLRLNSDQIALFEATKGNLLMQSIRTLLDGNAISR